MRIAIGQLWQETNTFNPLPTTRQDFEQFGVLRGADMVEKMADTNELGAFIQSLRQWPEKPEIVGLVRLPAWPSGTATHETFEWLRQEVLQALEGALPVDAVLLALHGAMVADGAPDVEGEILHAVRQRIGPKVPLVATLPSVAVALCGPGPRMGFACLFVDRSGEGGVALVEREFYGVEGTPIDIAAEDFNGDGSEDVAVIASVTQESPQGFVQVFLRQEHGFHALEPLPCGLKPRHVAAGDLDFDGRAEIAVASQNSHVVNLLRLSSSGELERLDDAGAGIGCLDLALVDVDLDGALDLLVANAFSNDVSVVLNQTRP